MRSSAPWAYLAAVLLADPTAASGPGARGGAGGGSERVRAPAVETHAARMGAAELGEGAGAAGVRWHAAASLGKGVAALWVPPSPEPVHLDEPSHLALGGSAWQDEPADPLSPEEQAAAAEEERTMWRALLSAVSESGEVAVQFRDLVGDGDDDDDEIACATDAAPTPEPGSPPDLQRRACTSSFCPARDVAARTPVKRQRPVHLPQHGVLLADRLGALLDRLPALPTARRSTASSSPIDPAPFRLFP